MDLAQLDAWIGCVVKTIDTGVRQSRKSYTLFRKLYGRYFHCAVAENLKMAWKGVEDVHAVKFSKGGSENEERRAV